MIGTLRDNSLLNYLSLFTSLGTLVCCALPSLLVFLGLGAMVASTLSAFPFLVALSRHKLWVFLLSGLLIGTNFAYVYWLVPKIQATRDACEVATACNTARRFTRSILWVSAGIYVVGVFVAYLLLPIVLFLENRVS